MTREEIAAKADELSKTLGVKVHPIVFKETEDGPEIVGYIKEPSRLVKLRMLDKTLLGPYTAAAEVLETILIKGESDPRIFSESPEHDKIYLGAVMAAYETVRTSVDQYKKK